MPSPASSRLETAQTLVPHIRKTRNEQKTKHDTPNIHFDVELFLR